MAPDSILLICRSCFVLLNACIPAPSSKAPASDWLPWSASSSVMVAGFGPRERSTTAPLSISPFIPRGPYEPSVETRIAGRGPKGSDHRGFRGRYRPAGDGAEARRLFASLPAGGYRGQLGLCAGSRQVGCDHIGLLDAALHSG